MAQKNPVIMYATRFTKMQANNFIQHDNNEALPCTRSANVFVKCIQISEPKRGFLNKKNVDSPTFVISDSTSLQN